MSRQIHQAIYPVHCDGVLYVRPKVPTANTLRLFVESYEENSLLFSKKGRSGIVRNVYRRNNRCGLKQDRLRTVKP